jgi:hypothetical protein
MQNNEQTHKVTIEMSVETYVKYMARKAELSEMMNEKLTHGEAMTGILAYLDAVIDKLNAQDELIDALKAKKD